MSNFTAWRSLVDGEEIGAIPDSVVYQYNSQDETLNDGETYTVYTDQQGNQNLDAVGGPVHTTTGINGYPSADTDGVDDYFESALPTTITPPAAIYIVVQLTDDGERQGLVTNGISTTEDDSIRVEARYDETRAFDLDWGGGLAAVSGTTPTGNTLIAAVNNGDGTGDLRVDGSSLSPDNAIFDGSEAINALALAALPFADVRYADALWGEIWIDDSASNIADKEEQLADRWELTLS